MSPSPVQLLQCSFTFAYGKFGFTPPLSERNTCSRPVNISFEIVGWKNVGAANATCSRSYRNGAASGVFSVSEIQKTPSLSRGLSMIEIEPLCQPSIE